ncbi:hypothetical protein ANN_12060 [Periplaneta americana]|uniref:Uncharacterized protein n=1 Tax=Periplaneta americana TaxID=6978 RepID=A0ABQ8T6T9_PERAM|nr:hypothetical protein ANN_12060 [Periplaneta americana]
MSPGSNTESYPAFAHIGLRENPGKNLNQVTCPDRESNPGHLVSRLDVLTVTPQSGLDYMPTYGDPEKDWCGLERKGAVSNLYTKQPVKVRIEEGMSDRNEIETGVRQGCPLSPPRSTLKRGPQLRTTVKATAHREEAPEV